ncbi:hypothetical protein L9F63_008793, partial [Diploptera punctata]
WLYKLFLKIEIEPISMVYCISSTFHIVVVAGVSMFSCMACGHLSYMDHKTDMLIHQVFVFVLSTDAVVGLMKSTTSFKIRLVSSSFFHIWNFYSIYFLEMCSSYASTS